MTKLFRRAQQEQGFTLIELLVVIMVIGILAAIALPAFLEQQQKGQDGKAKANARNLVSHMHTCFQEEDGFVGCAVRMTAAETGLPIGPGAGRVRVVSESETQYRVEAISLASSGGPHVFAIDFDQATGGATRTCTPVSRGGCQDDTDGDGLGEW